MKSVRKILSICLSLLTIALITVSGTLAYQTIQQNIESQPDSLQIDLIQSGDLFENASNPDFQILPIREGLSENEILESEQFLNHLFSVENTGNVDAFVRIAFAIPRSLVCENSDGKKALHIVESSSTNWSEAQFISDTDVNGVLCSIYLYTYKNELKPNEKVQDSPILGFYLDSAVTCSRNEYFLGNQRLEVSENGSFNMPVTAQSIQTDEFDNAKEAFEQACVPTFLSSLN